MDVTKLTNEELEKYIKIKIKEFDIKKEEMKIGKNYYQGNHDILKKQRLGIGENGRLMPILNLPNNKIVDNQYKKSIDQKINYILSKTPIIDAEEKKLKEELNEIFDDRMMRTLNKIALDTYNSGIGWLYVYTEGSDFSYKIMKPEEIIPIYEDTYYSEIYNIQTIKGYDHIQGLNQEVLERIIKKPWTNENVNFSERIWGKERTINRVLEKELTQGIIRGDDIKIISKKVSDIMNTSFKNEKRLVITENAHIHSVARHDSYKKMNIEKYEILATLDNRTSEICQDMDGKIFNMEDYQEGITSPPFHPHCRSCILPVIDDDIQKEMEDELGRIARDIKSGKTKVVGNVDFNYWYEKYALKKCK